jgi:hypothetical protein
MSLSRYPPCGLNFNTWQNFPPRHLGFRLWQAHCASYLRSGISQEDGAMKKMGRLGISIISGALLTVGAWALPATPPRADSQQDGPKGSVQLQSVSGTISTVQRSSFTLVTSAGTPGAHMQQISSDNKTMMFITDENTTVDGKLSVGANADVIYRDDHGNNMAVSVTISK